MRGIGVFQLKRWGRAGRAKRWPGAAAAGWKETGGPPGSRTRHQRIM